MSFDPSLSWDPTPPPQKNRRPKSISIILFCALGLIGTGILAVYLYIPIMEKMRAEKVFAQKTEELEQARLEHERQQRELSLIKSDPNYIENKAREILDVAAPGETILRIDREPANPHPEPDHEPNGKQNLP